MSFTHCPNCGKAWPDHGTACETAGAHCAGSTGSGPLYPWPPSDFDVEQAIAWGRQKHYKREFGEDAMYAVLVWEIDRLRLLAAPNTSIGLPENHKPI